MHLRYAALAIILVFSTAAASLFQAPPGAAQTDEPRAARGPATSGPVLLRSDESGATIEVHTPTYSFEQNIGTQARGNTLAIPGGTTIDRPGAPQLPKISFLIAVPPQAELQLSVLHSGGQPLAGVYDIPPAPSPAPLAEDLTPGEMEYRPDPAIYAGANKYPGTVAEISGEAWIRQQRVFRIDVHPFQYSPSRGELTWHPNITLRLDFQGDRSVGGCAGCRYDTELETALRHAILNYDQGIDWRVPAGSDALEGQIRSPLVTSFLGPRYEILVDRDGIYHMTYADLQAAGMDVDNVNPHTFRLTNHGQDVAIYVTGEGDGSFDPGDIVSFYGEKFRGDIMEARHQATMTRAGNIPNDPTYAANNWFWQCKSGCDLASYFERYTDDNVYYLLEGGAPGPRMGSLSGAPGGASVPTYYFETMRAEKQLYWWSHEFHDDEVWFWQRVQVLDTEMNYTTTLSAVASAPVSATLHVEVSSRNEDPFNSPDHHTQFRFNGSVVHDTYWDGKVRYTFDASIPQNTLVEGTNTVGMTLLSDSVLLGPSMYFDFFEITYAREFNALNDGLIFAPAQAGTWRYEISGLSSSGVEVYDVLDPFNPVRVTNPGVSGGGGNFTASFQVSHGSSARYAAAGTGAGILAPKSITFYNPPDFAGMAPVEYVLITHADFMAAAQELADYRQSRGLSTAVIDVADLYREFNDGIYHPIAIKNFLAYTFANWQDPVGYATLIGSGNWNFKGDGAPGEQYANPPPTYMPPNLAYADPWQGEVDSANLLATVVGNDTLPDLHVARIPVDTNAAMSAMVDKITAYESAAFAGWQDNILFITDDVPDTAGNFIQLAEGIINTYLNPYPNYTTQRLYQDDGDGIPNGYDFGCRVTGSPNCKAFTQAITNTINTSGALLVNYLGHASINLWSKQQILTTSNLATLNNANQLPVVLSMTCLDGFWTYPNWNSMVFELLNHPTGGAVATFSATGLGVATGHDPLQRGFFASLVENGDWELGAAAMEGKIQLFLSGFNYDLMHTFTLFGDPALGLKSPFQAGLTPASAGINGEPGESIVYNLQVKNNGAHPDTFDVTLAGNSWSSTPSSTTVGPLNPGQSAALVVTVDIPAGAVNNDVDSAQVTVRSQGDTGSAAAATLTTTVVTNWIALTPPLDTRFGSPGEAITYTLQVRNANNLTDTYGISLSGNGWQVDAPSQIGPLSPGASAPLQVVVHIPAGAAPGQFDFVSLTLTSQVDSGHTASAGLQTIVQGGSIYAPVIRR